MPIRPTFPIIAPPALGPTAADGGLPWQRTGSGSWSPAMLGPKLWYRGDAGVVSSSTKITTWIEQMGTGHNFTQSTDANRPLNTRTVNGLVAPDFTGNPVRMITAANNSTVLGTPGILETHVVWIADALVAGTGFSAPNLCGQDTNNYWTHSAGASAAYSIYTDTGGVARTATSGAAPSTGVVYRSRAYNDGAQVHVKLGSGAVVSATCTGANSASYTNNKLLIGWNASQNAFFDGAICEILVFTRATSAAERSALDTWFVARWGATV